MKIVLFQPDIAQNLGAVMRLTACFNIALEVIEPCGFPLTAKSLRRTAMDYGTPESLMRHKSWAAFQTEQAASPQPQRVVLFTTQAATPLHRFDFKADDTLLFGRESAGVPQEVHDYADQRVIIPLAPTARSFNLASSVSIGLWEALRQTQLKT
jgi:tRNA (cytidine/uridine-2'-O-)-methyltransferase